MKESEGLQSSRDESRKKGIDFFWFGDQIMQSKDESFEEERLREDWIWWETLTVQSMFLKP